jgi:pSer/pThr/pTyr-binding forkhead associated (FHA) protein
MKAELVPENGEPPIPITRDLVVVGRRDYCDIVIDHSSLSKRHCVLLKTDGLLVIRDLISTNGTKVKGQRIRWAALLPDDRITLGTYRLRVYLGPDDTPSPSELHRERAQKRGAVPYAAPAPSDAVHSKASTGAGTTQGNSRPAHIRSFPEPSPLELPIHLSDDDRAAGIKDSPDDDMPLMAIVLDDDDEVIDLD